MNGAQAALLLAAATLGVTHVVTERRLGRTLDLLLKPAPIALLALLVAAFSPDAPPVYRALVIAGLALSAVGDVLLLDADRFAAGLVAFLLAHLVYIAAFFGQSSGDPSLLRMLPLVLWGGIAFWVLRPGLGKLRVPVLVYVAVIMTMIWTAGEMAVSSGLHAAQLAAAGALVFGVSDTLLAVARFRHRFAFSQPMILLTYYLAQCLIAASAARWPQPA